MMVQESEPRMARWFSARVTNMAENTARRGEDLNFQLLSPPSPALPAD